MKSELQQSSGALMGLLALEMTCGINLNNRQRNSF